jgi:hypothetical protein
MFKHVIGGTGGLPTSENYLNFQWVSPECNILFSVTQMGKALSCHFTSDKSGLRHLRQAINEFAVFCFDIFPWSCMIIARVNRRSVGKLITKCGFERLVGNGNNVVYIRRR